MSHYFSDRRQILEEFIEINSRWKVNYKVFKRWQLRNTQTCYCGTKGTIKFSRSRGVSQTALNSLQSAIEGSIGVAGLATIKSSVTSSLGEEVQWTRTESEEMTFECVAPECGRTELTVYELLREYEIAAAHRGVLFKSDYWDVRWRDTFYEAVGEYTGVPDSIPWDPKCKCKVSPQPPECEGRLSLDMGTVCLLVPYRMEQEKKQLVVRIEKLDVHVDVHEWEEFKDDLHGKGRRLIFKRGAIPSMFRILGGLEAETISAHARVYRDGENWDEIFPGMLSGPVAPLKFPPISP
ncbi:MAG TPA: hypothetical protein VJS37_03980 [Terriglobales bacterium]|nr:hypothetical protein [Terriglobales bacterium]